MADSNQSDSSNQRQPMSPGQRNAWILTAYGIFGLGLLCAIAYTVAQYAVQ